MLLGEKDEINAARSFIVGMAEEHNASVDPLIQALRSSLRRELELGEVAMPSPYNLRIEMHVNEKQAGSNSLRGNGVHSIVDEIDPLPELEKGRKQPYVRQSYKVLKCAHSSVEQLFAAAGALEAVRREAKGSKKGRKARLEVDILPSAIVMTSAGLDASMKRLVDDVGRELIVKRRK